MKDYINQLYETLLKIEITDFNKLRIDLGDVLEGIITTMSKRAARAKKVVIIGNGGSASIANHTAVDLWKNGKIRAISFSDSSMLTCVSNDFGYHAVYEKPIDMFCDEGDTLIAISSSGKSENILNGVKAAKNAGCDVITMSGFKPDNPLRSAGRINFFVPSDSYGFVEVAHQVICHAFIDRIVSENSNG